MQSPKHCLWDIVNASLHPLWRKYFIQRPQGNIKKNGKQAGLGNAGLNECVDILWEEISMVYYTTNVNITLGNYSELESWVGSWGILVWVFLPSF